MAVPRIVLYLSLCAGFACASSAFAGVGTTSAGVTTTDPNSQSTDVQQQSSSFVAANQQLQSGTANGIALPGGAVSSTQPGQNGTGNAGANGTQTGQPGDAHNAATEHAVPAAPPPPPPVYESKMRPVNATAVVAPAPAQPAASTKAVLKPELLPQKAAGKQELKPALVPATTQNRAVPVEKKQDEPAPTVTTDPGGGRGAAPDGYTFWLGLLIAGALLALAGVTYLRIQRGEAPG